MRLTTEVIYKHLLKAPEGKIFNQEKSVDLPELLGEGTEFKISSNGKTLFWEESGVNHSEDIDEDQWIDSLDSILIPDPNFEYPPLEAVAI